MEFTFNPPSKPDISSFDKNVDPDQLASQKPANYGHPVFNFSCSYMLITRILQVTLVKIGEERIETSINLSNTINQLPLILLHCYTLA